MNVIMKPTIVFHGIGCCVALLYVLFSWELFLSSVQNSVFFVVKFNHRVHKEIQHKGRKEKHQTF